MKLLNKFLALGLVVASCSCLPSVSTSAVNVNEIDVVRQKIALKYQSRWTLKKDKRVLQSVWGPLSALRETLGEVDLSKSKEENACGISISFIYMLQIKNYIVDNIKSFCIFNKKTILKVVNEYYDINNKVQIPQNSCADDIIDLILEKYPSNFDICQLAQYMAESTYMLTAVLGLE